jgi:DNA modification methylase
MKPYYQDESVTIYHGDCREVLPSIEADLLLTDPPYGLMAVSDSGGFGRRQNHADEYRTIAGDDSGEIRNEALRLWGNGDVAVFHSPRLPEPPGSWDWRLVWDKCRPGMNSGPWRYSHELIFCRGAGWTRVNDSAVSVFRVPAIPAPVHPNEKPASLLRALVRAHGASTVLDPFMGSGTTLRAAKDLGRKAIGIEIEERYCEIAAKRMAQEVLAFG